MTELLAVESLTRRFGGLTAVDHVSFAARAGEIVGLIGPNGAGKTTVFNLITGILAPTSGEVRLRGQSIARPPAPWPARLLPRYRGTTRPHRITARGIARTFQTIRLFRNLTALENVMAGLHHRARAGVWDALAATAAQKREENWMITEAERLLAELDLSVWRDEPAKNLPYGLQRRLEIARALATRPVLLALDEPAAGLNERETGELMERVRAIRDGGVTVLVIEHDMPMVMALCERIVVLDQGCKIAEGTPAQMQSDPQVIAAYLGEASDAQGGTTS